MVVGFEKARHQISREAILGLKNALEKPGIVPENSGGAGVMPRRN
jgi:hypothetical protein